MTITGTDSPGESGVDKLYYYISSEELSLTEVEAVTAWKELPATGTSDKSGSFVVDPDKKFIVYAKITDISGNVTYLNSTGFILDGTAPVITGVESGSTYCSAKAITVTDANLKLKPVTVNGTPVELTEGTYTLAADGTTYTIVAEDVAGNTTTVKVTVNDGHTLGEWAVVKAPTCTEQGSRKRVCAACDYMDTEGITALGHDWGGEWTVIREATAKAEGKKARKCKHGCGQTQYEIIPKTGEEETSGNLEKDAQVAPDAPVEGATIDNSKDELIKAPVKGADGVGIWDSVEEQQAVENGTVDARIWMEVEAVAPADAEKVKFQEKAAAAIGSGVKLTYFTANLFKKVGDGATTQIKEPGIAIKVTIMIPDEMLNHDETIERVYYVLRMHDGEVDVINGTFDSATKEFSFETDKFSTYAIAYKDSAIVIPPGPEDPAAPGTPAAPGSPAAPGTPAVPGTPAAPGIPAVPGTPSAPGAVIPPAPNTGGVMDFLSANGVGGVLLLGLWALLLGIYALVGVRCKMIG